MPSLFYTLKRLRILNVCQLLRYCHGVLDFVVVLVTLSEIMVENDYSHTFSCPLSFDMLLHANRP